MKLCQPGRQRLVNGWLLRVQGLVLPPNCVLCGERGQPPMLDLCPPCAADLELNGCACQRCAAPLAGTTSTLMCGRCLRRPPRFDSAFAPFRYAYPLDQLLRAFKYRGILSYGRVLGSLLASHVCARGGPLPERIIPVPLHPSRHRERGFNQASELALPVSRRLNVPLDERLCRRIRATVDQTELDARLRRRNVRRAFEVVGSTKLRHVALLDDVLTTGSTASELARVLKRAGVRTVEIWAVARAHSVKA
jgi:ComF family protein